MLQKILDETCLRGCSLCFSTAVFLIQLLRRPSTELHAERH